MANPQRNESPVGQLIKSWRGVRRLSQLALALEAEISARHLSFIETGRSQPSREMVLQVAEALDVPLREKNSFLLAAGYAPLYHETDLDAPEMSRYRHVIEMILKGYEPFFAVALDRYWNVLLANEGFSRFLQIFNLPVQDEPINLLTMLFSDDGLRHHIRNWDEIGYQMIQRVHREAIDESSGTQSRELLQSLLGARGIPKPWNFLDVQRPQDLMLPVHINLGGVDLHYVSTITTLGTPQDITLQELRIEAFMPADEATEIATRGLADAAAART